MQTLLTYHDKFSYSIRPSKDHVAEFKMFASSYSEVGLEQIKTFVIQKELVSGDYTTEKTMT